VRIEKDISKVQVIKPAVSAVIFDGDGKVLLHRRSDNGQWGLPGGSVEIGETVSQALVREVKEETGLDVRIIRCVGVYSDPRLQMVSYPDGRGVHYISTVFECQITGGTLTLSPETLELGFFDPYDLPADIVPSHVIRIQDAMKRQEAAFIR
jgi:ADP-ribose pyrophosphatase YjhB (NUDIX family)